MTMAMEKIHAIGVCEVPKWSTRETLKTLNA